MKRRKSSISSRQGRFGHISNGYGALVCWKGEPVVAEHWNTGSANQGGRGFAGCVRRVDSRTNERSEMGENLGASRSTVAGPLVVLRHCTRKVSKFVPLA